MGAWGIKALERDEGLDVLDILKNECTRFSPRSSSPIFQGVIGFSFCEIYKSI